MSQKQQQAQNLTPAAHPQQATSGAGQREHPLQHLQHTLGNQAVHRMVQAHATARVMQTKLAINQPGDEYEREADHVAEQVMRMPDPQLQRECTCGGTCSKCQGEHSGHEHEHLQMKQIQASDTGQMTAPPIVDSVLHEPGQPLDPATRAFMEPRFGHDFSGVRVHADATAEQSARDVNAHAYTVGSKVVFGTGRFAPGTHEGRRLLAHELTHVVQQTRGNPQPYGKQDRGNEAATQVRTTRHIGLARQQDPALTVPLSWDELFNKIISDQRAFLLTLPEEANAPAIDQRGVGRGVGPDRTLRGLEVLAVIQVVDRNGRRVAIGFGAHALLPGGHGEEQALKGLEHTLPVGTDLRGGKMMVVVDQFPCGPDRHDCGLQLRRFAEERGLDLEVKVPQREHAQRAGVTVKPRAASKGAYRSDLAANKRTQVRLVTIEHLPAPSSHESGGPGGTPPSSFKPDESTEMAPSSRVTASTTSGSKAEGSVADESTAPQSRLVNPSEDNGPVSLRPTGPTFKSNIIRIGAGVGEGLLVSLIFEYVSSKINQYFDRRAFEKRLKALQPKIEAAKTEAYKGIPAKLRSQIDKLQHYWIVQLRVTVRTTIVVAGRGSMTVVGSPVPELLSVGISTSNVGDEGPMEEKKPIVAPDLHPVILLENSHVVTYSEPIPGDFAYMEGLVKIKVPDFWETRTLKMDKDVLWFSNTDRDVLRFSNTGKEVTESSLLSWAKQNHPHGLDDPTLLQNLYASHEFKGSNDARERAAIALVLKLREEKRRKQ